MVVIFAIKKRLEFFKRFIYNLNIELLLKKVSFTEKVGQGVLQQVEMIGFIYKHLQYLFAFLLHVANQKMSVDVQIITEAFYHQYCFPFIWSEWNDLVQILFLFLADCIFKQYFIIKIWYFACKLTMPINIFCWPSPLTLKFCVSKSKFMAMSVISVIYCST